MDNHVYVVDPRSMETSSITPTTFSSLNIKERRDLQSWLKNTPNLLGEPLLFIADEFDRFDNSNKRLDMLLLDESGTLVVAELKLDASGTLAEQQAVRYAAFCSTMTMQDVIFAYSRQHKTSTEDAEATLRQFLQVDELPELTNEPRIMLVAGSFCDQELTSTVMWLRKFGVDITCIELTPFRYPGDEEHILIVPKTLIPLPEAQDYQIRVERKVRVVQSTSMNPSFSAFFQMVLEHYKDSGTDITGPSKPSNNDYMSLHIGHGQIHYEWLVRRRTRTVDVALHFEAKDRDLNFDRLNIVLERYPELSSISDHEMVFGNLGKNWAQITFRIPFKGLEPGNAEAEQAAKLMGLFVRKTLPLLRSLP